MLTWYADYRNTFKPLAIDFGPEAEVDVLQPETGVSFEVGAKCRLLDGRVDFDASLFRMNFRNGLTFTQDANGNFGPANSGESRFQGFEIESRIQLAHNVQIAAHYANHDARYVNFTGGDGINVSGNRIEMSPRQLGGIGILYAPSTGLNGSVVVDYVGPRELDASNALTAGGYTNVDASLTYSLGHYHMQLSGYNLTNIRGPVSSSELNQSVTVTQTAGYYRLPARVVQLELRYAW
jgi:iron complex outermembrane receptor protein